MENELTNDLKEQYGMLIAEFKSNIDQMLNSNKETECGKLLAQQKLLIKKIYELCRQNNKNIPSYPEWHSNNGVEAASEDGTLEALYYYRLVSLYYVDCSHLYIRDINESLFQHCRHSYVNPEAKEEWLAEKERIERRLEDEKKQSNDLRNYFMNLSAHYPITSSKSHIAFSYRVGTDLIYTDLTDNLCEVFLDLIKLSPSVSPHDAAIKKMLLEKLNPIELNMFNKLLIKELNSSTSHKENADQSLRESGIFSGDRKQHRESIKWYEQKISLCNELFNLLAGMNVQTLLNVVPSSYNHSFNLENEMAHIIGLHEVKDFLKSLHAQIKIKNERIRLGLSVGNQQTLHMVFRGNPGTGKTTVARLLGKMLNELGVLPTSKVIETDRSGLVAEYVGQTAIKTKNKISEAFGGVLFIDEAYALATDAGFDGSGFGQEAIDTLVKEVDDHRDKLVVILAGYGRDMDQFFKTNPGLKSRFPNVIEFTDYSSEELLSLIKNLYQKQEYVLTTGAETKLMTLFANIRLSEDFGNGRSVRNVYEKSLRLQSLRLSQKENLVREDLVTITEFDIE